MTEQKRPFNGILYLGAGKDRNLGKLAELTDQLYLVEAQPKLADALRQSTMGMSHVRVIEKAVAANEQRVSFYDYNLHWACGINLPTGLVDIYPGLAKTAEYSLNTVSFEKLLADCEISDEKRYALILDLPGMELELIKALPAEKLQCFEEIAIVTANRGVYDREFDPDELVQLCEPFGYSLIQSSIPSPASLHPWQTLIYLGLDRNRAKMEHQQGLIDQMKKAMELSEEKLKDSELRNRSLLERLDAMKLDYEQRLENAEKNNSLLTLQCDELKTELDAAENDRKKLQSKVEEMEPNQQGLQQSLQNSEDSNAEIYNLHQHEKKALEEKVSELNQTLLEAQESIGRLTEKLAGEQESAAQLSGQVHQLKSELDEKAALYEKNRQDMSIALRMQAVRDADLKELQQRYTELLSVKETQEALLRKLTERLSLAAGYLQKIKPTEQACGPSQALMGELVEAFSGGPD